MNSQSVSDSMISSSALQAAYNRIKELETENYALKEHIEQIEIEIQSKCERMQKLQEQTDQARSQYNELLSQVVELNLKNRTSKEKMTNMQTEMQKKIMEAQTQLTELRMQLQDKNNQLQLVNTTNMKEHEDYIILSGVLKSSMKLIDPSSNTDNPTLLVELISKLVSPKPSQNAGTQTDAPRTSEIKPLHPESDTFSEFSVERRKHRSHRRKSERSETSSRVSSHESSRSDKRFQFDHIDSDVAIDVPLDRFIQIHNRLRSEEQDYSMKSRDK